MSTRAAVAVLLFASGIGASTQAQTVDAGIGSAALAPIAAIASQPGGAEVVVGWRDSWRDWPVSERGNYDGIWLFAKWRDAMGRWHHAKLAEALAREGEGFVASLSVDQMGAFVYRAEPGRGQALASIALRWSEVASNASVVRLFAWPLVYVPEGAFALGDGGPTTPGRFHDGADPGRPFRVTSAPIPLAPRERALWADATPTPLPAGAPGPSPWDAPGGTVPDAYPTGYRAFWIQRYELTQGQYADFLNTLSPAQAAARAPSNADFESVRIRRPGNFRYTLLERRGVWRAAQPLWSMNWLSWDDGAAVADWAGLRPMSELEFEKAARGAAPALAGEYAWGSTRIVAIRGFDGVDGSGDETALPPDANTSWSPARDDRPLLGPYRAGLLANRATREGRGESYWGVADLSGNLVEMAVTLGLAAGRAFVPGHGDGALSEAGRADVDGWPRIETRGRAYGAFGFGYRGGDFFNPERDLRTSSRNVATFGGARRLFGLGFRAVRSVDSPAAAKQ